jgi:hypothetical protein
LIVDTQFETSGTPIDKLNSSPSLDARNRLICVARDNISTVEKRTSHVMSCPGITNDHLIVRFETLEGDILDAMGFMLRLCFRDNWRARNQGIVDAGVRDQICLEFCEIDVQGSFESEGRSD